MRPTVGLAVMVLLAACAPVEKQATLSGASIGAVRTAGPGDTVMEFDLKKPLPNAFGKADVFGRTTYAGRTSVRFVGAQSGVALFERSDLSVETDATTMSQTPLYVPHTTTTNISGTVGNAPFSGSASSTSYSVVGPRPSRSYTSASQPILIRLSAGQSVRIEGRSLTVVRVSPASVEYRID